MTDDFLRSQGNYAVAKTPQKTLVNRPVLTEVPNERWAVDLIDMEAFNIPAVNANRAYIMTVIDHFSGKVWARGIVNRENNANTPTLSDAMQSICQASNTVPHILQGDGEFGKGAFRQWCRANNIQFVQSTPFSPTSNGKVERMNREIRRKIRANMIRNNNFQWFADLQPLIENINRQVKSRNGLRANQLWRPGYNPHPPGRNDPVLQPVQDDFNIQQRQDYQEAFLRDQATQLLAQGRPPRFFQNGNLVRIKMTTASNVMRQARKNEIGYNKVSIHYTPQIFRIRRSFQYPPGALQRDQYVLENLNGEILRQGGNERKFFGSDLILVPHQNVQTNVNPRDIFRTLQFNRFA
jgi:transposase InsO family protein